MLSRRGVGTAVFGGMIFASAFGIFMIPVLYVIFQWAREKLKGLADQEDRSKRHRRLRRPLIRPRDRVRSNDSRIAQNFSGMTLSEISTSW